jgi:hypothetical protein
MSTIRYTGEDIPADFILKDDDGTVIDPTSLAGMKVYVLDIDKNILLKGSYPVAAGFEEIIMQETFARMWLPKSFTTEIPNKKLQFEVAVYETEADLEGGIQTSIAVSETITIKDVKIKNEEPEEES